MKIEWGGGLTNSALMASLAVRILKTLVSEWSEQICTCMKDYIMSSACGVWQWQKLWFKPNLFHIFVTVHWKQNSCTMQQTKFAYISTALILNKVTSIGCMVYIYIYIYIYIYNVMSSNCECGSGKNFHVGFFLKFMLATSFQFLQCNTNSLH